MVKADKLANAIDAVSTKEKSVKENENEFNDLISLRKIGYGKVSVVDYNFIVDKDFNARVEIKMDTEFVNETKSTEVVKLKSEERKIIGKFILNFLNSKFKELSYTSDNIEKYERKEILYNNLVIDDEELNKRFETIIDYIQSEHEEISADTISKMYNEMCNDIYNNNMRSR